LYQFIIFSVSPGKEALLSRGKAFEGNWAAINNSRSSARDFTFNFLIILARRSSMARMLRFNSAAIILLVFPAMTK